MQRFYSKPELILARILDRDCLKWFRPVQGQFRIGYRVGHSPEREYIPDFVAETEILMIEVKEDGELEDETVVAKQRAAETWCALANSSLDEGGKRWRYWILGSGGVSEAISL